MAQLSADSWDAVGVQEWTPFSPTHEYFSRSPSIENMQAENEDQSDKIPELERIVRKLERALGEEQLKTQKAVARAEDTVSGRTHLWATCDSLRDDLKESDHQIRSLQWQLDKERERFEKNSASDRRLISELERNRQSKSKVKSSGRRPPNEKGRKREFLRKNDDIDEEALTTGAKTEMEVTASTMARDDNRSKWAATTIATKSIKVLSREFAANKKYRPSGFTTVFYDRNEPKNRYNDIICIDATRVILKDRPSDEDYIHASWMTMPDHFKYICTQLCRQLAEKNPITVHCSAGIGRSATFVAIDYAWQKIKDNGSAQMVDVLKDLRGQRFQAIQSPIQYIFLHMCLLELAVEDNLIARKGKYSPYLSSYQTMLRKYNKKVAAAEARAEAQGK